MSFSRVVVVFLALSPFAFGASKEIMELQRDVALLQDQVRTLQSSLDQKVAAIQTLTQQTLDSVNRTNTAVAVMQSSFNDTMKQAAAKSERSCRQCRAEAGSDVGGLPRCARIRARHEHAHGQTGRQDRRP